MSCSRREFLQTTLITVGSVSLAGSAASFLQSCSKAGPTASDNGNFQPAPIELDLSAGANQALLNVGGTLALGADALDQHGVLLIRTSAGEVNAFSRQCTHQGCTIGAFDSSGVSTCPCHGSKFNTSGGVVKGPASSPLKQYTTELNGTTLTVSP
jgi:cytochrome b6-f complex iron-sulfur subunit